VQWHWQEKAKELEEKSVLLPLCPPQVTSLGSYPGLSSDRLTIWVMARSLIKKRKITSAIEQVSANNHFTLMLKTTEMRPSLTYRYCVLSVQGLTARTTIKTCWNCERIFFGVNGWAPGSWKTMVTISLPMWRLRSSCWRLFGVNGRSVETWNIISQPWYCEYTE